MSSSPQVLKERVDRLRKDLDAVGDRISAALSRRAELIQQLSDVQDEYMSLVAKSKEQNKGFEHA